MRSASALVIGIFLLGEGACRSDRQDAGMSTSLDLPVRVRSVSVERQERSEVISLVGSVHARRSVSVSPRVMAQIQAVRVEEGEAVRTGDLLVELDDREMVASLQAAEAELRMSGEAIGVSEHLLEAAQARLEIAEVTLQRFQNLLARESVSRHEYDQASSAAEEARAAVAAARARKQEAISRQQQARAGESSARVRLGHTRLLSPIDGIVTERLQDPGSLAVPGQPVLLIEDVEQPMLHLAVPESVASKVQVGQRLPVELDALANEGLQEGTVMETVPRVDTTSRTFVVKVRVPELTGLRSGQYGRALLSLAPRSVLVIPEEAVLEQGQIRSVFVLEESRARRRLVTLGAQENGRYEVLSGLTAGERVALNPTALRDGSLVEGADSPLLSTRPPERLN